MAGFDPLSAVITGGAQLLGGLFGGFMSADAQDAANQLNWEMQLL